MSARPRRLRPHHRSGEERSRALAPGTLSPSIWNRSLVLGLAGLLLFSGYGAFLPAHIRCALPGAVGCPGGLLPFAAPAPAGATQQWFNVIAYDYGFWVTDTVSGANDSSAWPVYEGWTVNVNVTSFPPNPSVGGVNQHGVGIDISGSGNVFSVSGPVGSWNQGSFVAPTTPSTGNRVYCTIYCGPGHSSQVAHILNVVPPPNVPTATASGTPTSDAAPLAVTFLGSAAGGSAPYTYLWNFGDGSLGSAAPSPQHVYNVSGAYSAKLTVTDSTGVSAIATVAVSVQAASHLVVSASGSPLSGKEPLPVTLSASATGGAPPYAWVWDYGDGSSGIGASVSHVYALPGTFVATVRAVDAGGTAATSTVLVNVSAAGPALPVSIASSAASGPAPFGVTLNASATGGTAPYNVTWDLGDGTMAWGSSLTHTYSVQGTYVATATVRDASGSEGAATTVLTVSGTAASPLALHLGPTPAVGASPLAVSVGGSEMGGTPPYAALAWSFGDGTTGSGSVVTHTYASPGNYTLSATGKDAVGTTVSASSVIVVVGFGLHLALSGAQGDAPAQLNGSGSVFGGSGVFGPVAWAWGDGTTSSGPIVSHVYASSSSTPYSVVATVHDSAGATVTGTGSFLVFPPLAVVLNASLSSATPPVHASFSLKASGGSGSYPSGVLWNFGDGTSTRGGLTASENYTKAGSYHVTASAVDSAGGAALGSTWVNVSLAGSLPPGGSGNGGPTGPLPPPWLGNGVGNPTQTSLVLLFIMSAVALALVLQGRRKRLSKQGSKPAHPAGRAPNGISGTGSSRAGPSSSTSSGPASARGNEQASGSSGTSPGDTEG